MKKTRFGLVVLAATGMVIVATGCGGKAIDMSKYVDVYYDGANGYGTAVVDFNRDAYLSDWGDKVKYKGSDEEAKFCAALESGAEVVLEYAHWNTEPSTGLSNGDKVTVKWSEDEDILKDFNMKIKTSDQTFTVEGLQDVVTFDAFSGVDVTFNGDAPDGTATLKNENSIYTSYSCYDLDKKNGLSNGDVVTVSISDETINEYVEQCGMIPEEKTKEYTVSGLTAYASSVADLTPDCLEKMENQANDALEAYIAEDSDGASEFVSSELMGYWFMAAKENAIVFDKNQIYLVQKVERKEKDSQETFTYYWYTIFKNIVVLEDGSCSMSYSDYEVPAGGWFSDDSFDHNNESYAGFSDYDTMFNKCVTSNRAEYSCENTVVQK